jgi:hypothetical protein
MIECQKLVIKVVRTTLSVEYLELFAREQRFELVAAQLIMIEQLVQMHIDANQYPDKPTKVNEARAGKMVAKIQLICKAGAGVAGKVCLP